MAGDHIFLAEIEGNPKPGPYADAIVAAQQSGSEYWGIWNILAFHPTASYHLCELSHQVMFQPGPLSAALRELIAAYTSSLNRCDFCMRAHASVAAHLYSDRALVADVLHDPETSPLSLKEKALLRFVRQLTLQPSTITEHDTECLKAAGWEEPSIFYAVEACALFNYYNRFVMGNGVKLVSAEAFHRLGERMAKHGYSREKPPSAQKQDASHA